MPPIPQTKKKKQANNSLLGKVMINDDPKSQNETTIDHYLRRKVFFIHGTDSSPKRWVKWPRTVPVMMKIANCNEYLVKAYLEGGVNTHPNKNDVIDCSFSWEDWSSKTTNDVIDRKKSSDKLVKHVKEYAENFDEVVLIGHSHGGNVAIQAANSLANDYKHVYVITVATPAQNVKEFTVAEPKLEGLLPHTTKKKTKAYFRGGMAPSMISVEITEHTYKNPENPANWQQKNIAHLALWNDYDRVDGMALASNKLPGAIDTMTSTSDYFTYDPSVNVKISVQRDNAIEGYEDYIKEVEHRISLLNSLRGLIIKMEQLFEWGPYETPQSEPRGKTIELFNRQQPVIIDQHVCLRDKMTIVQPQRILRDIKSVKYLEVPPLPPIKEFNFNIYQKNKSQSTSAAGVYFGSRSNALIAMTKLFDKNEWVDFRKALDKAEYTTEPSETYQKISRQLEKIKDLADWDLRSDNIKLIDAVMLALELEKANMEMTIQMLKDDKSNFSKYNKWGLLFGIPGYIATRSGLSYLDKGIDNHSFDTATPEEIEKAIEDGRIKPFERVRRSQVKETKD